MAGDGHGRDFSTDFDAMVALAVRPAATADEITANLKQINAIALEADPSRYGPAAIGQHAEKMAEALGYLRLTLRDQVGDWHARGLLVRSVQDALRDCFRTIRYSAEMMGEMAIGHARLVDDEKPHSAFAGAPGNVLRHPAEPVDRPLAFRSGDVVLARGLRHNSAAIARIGEVDSQFSHIAMIHIDRTGAPCVVEALIEEGAIINSLEHALGHGLGRAVLFRHKDAALAARAADLIHEHVRRSRSGQARHIPYDFSMRLDGYRKLFCSKLVRQAFDEASRGGVKLPTYATRLVTTNVDFLRRIGVKAKETFAPGDMELEPQFDLVAEWADFRVTSDLRLQDFIMTKMFEWMEVEGWRFKEDFAIRLVGWFGRIAANLSDRVKDLISDLVPKIPSNMRRRTIATVAMLHKTAQPLLEGLQEKERDCIARYGRQLHASEVFAHLDEVKARSGGQIGYLVAPRR
jgi:hypothetical protein